MPFARRSKTIESLKRNKPVSLYHAISANFRCLRGIRAWHRTCADAQGGGIATDMELGFLGERNCIVMNSSAMDQNLIHMNGGSCSGRNHDGKA